MKHKLSGLYDHAEEVILVILFAIMVVVIFLQVIMRYLFNNSLSWTEETGKYIFVWLSWIGVSLGAKKGEHIKITAITQKFSGRYGHLLNILSELIVITICAVTVYYGTVVCRMMLELGAMNAALHINQVWGYAAIPVGCGLMILRSIQSLCRSFGNLRYGDPRDSAAGRGG